jgi:hypothetical protein
VALTSKSHQGSRGRSKNGFILLEVLVAMSLMVGAWMTLIQSCQRLSWKLAQQEQQKMKLRKEWDANEFSLVGKVISSDSSGVFSGSRAVHATAQPTSQIKR